MTAYNIIKKYGWIRGSYGDTKRGFCAVGALNRAYPDPTEYLEMCCRLHMFIGNNTLLESWNDQEGCTKQQVLALFKKVGV